MRIGLMADVPDQPVARCVEHVMQRDRQLDDAKACAKVAAGDGYGVDGFLAQFVSELAQVAFGQRAKLGRRGDAV